jgi:chemotaxis signal transduction protein
MSLRGRQNLTSTAVETARLLVLRLGTNYVALPAVGVHGILTRSEAAGGQAVTAAGVVYPLVDLAQRLSLAADFSGIEMRTVLYSTGRSQGAIPVEQVVGLVDVERKDCRPLPPQFQRDERNWFGGMMLYRDQLVLILNPAWALGESADAGAASIGQAGRMCEATPAAIGGSC